MGGKSITWWGWLQCTLYSVFSKLPVCLVASVNYVRYWQWLFVSGIQVQCIRPLLQLCGTGNTLRCLHKCDIKTVIDISNDTLLMFMTVLITHNLFIFLWLVDNVWDAFWLSLCHKMGHWECHLGFWERHYNIFMISFYSFFIGKTIMWLSEKINDIY